VILLTPTLNVLLPSSVMKLVRNVLGQPQTPVLNVTMDIIFQTRLHVFNVILHVKPVQLQAQAPA